MATKKIRECVNKIWFYERLAIVGDGDEELSMIFEGQGSFILKKNTPLEMFSEVGSKKDCITGSVYEVLKGEFINVTSSTLKKETLFESREFSIYSFEMVVENDIGDSRFRLVMKYEDAIRLFFLFESVFSICTDMTSGARNAIKVKVGSGSFLVYFSDGYFFVESDDVCELSPFIESCRCILAGMSFVSGKCPGGYAYIFEYEGDYKSGYKRYHFDSSFLNKRDDSIHTYVNSNIYDYCQDMEGEEKNDFIEGNRQYFRGLSEESFTSLCSLILTDDKFSNGVFSIVEARSSSLPAMCALNSVALESLSSFVMSKNSEKYQYVKNKSDRKELRELLLREAEAFFSNKQLDVSFEGSPIQKRINNITGSTNSDKFAKCFEVLSIPLLEGDMSIIDKRNDILHGNVLYGHEIGRDEQFYGYFSDAFRLSFLVNAIVLKHIGHEGYIRSNAGYPIDDHVKYKKTYRRI